MEHLTRSDLRKNIMTILYQINVYKANRIDYEIDDAATWMIDVSGYYTTGIKNYLVADGIPEAGADTIISNAAKVLGYCPNPASDEEKKLIKARYYNNYTQQELARIYNTNQVKISREEKKILYKLRTRMY